MKLWFLFAVILIAAAVAADSEENKAEECDPETCQLPDCRCSSTEIPGGLDPRDVPQVSINVN